MKEYKKENQTKKNKEISKMSKLVNRPNNNELVVSENSSEINLSPREKTELVTNKVQKLNVLLGAEDIQIISSRLNDSFISKRSMTINLNREINRYLEWLENQEFKLNKETMTLIESRKNEHNQLMMEQMNELADFIEQDKSIWEGAVNHALELFKIPEE